MNIRKLEKSDYYKGFIELLGQLTDAPKMSYDDFLNFYNQLANEYIFVLELDDIIVSTGTLLLEQKFIHNGGKCGHIEDIVVHSDYRGKDLGKMMIEFLSNLAYYKGCYKVILDCKPELESFYEKCGFTQKGSQMSFYF